MSLETGEQMDGRVVAVLPITEDVITRVEEFGQKQKQPYRESRMLQYEWRPGQNVGPDDQIENDHHTRPQTTNGFDVVIIPDPVDQPQEDDAIDDPQPLQNIAELPPTHAPCENQGAQEHEIQDQHDNDDTQGRHDEQEAFENQGAQEIDNTNQEAEAITFEEVDEDEEIDEDAETESDEEDDSSEDESDTETRKEEKKRRSVHFEINTGDEYGRGKRETKTTPYSFLQTKFENMNQDDRKDFFHHAWSEYKVSGKTNLLERFTTGFIFNQLSAKEGIKRYGREAELKLLAEFKQLMEYKTFHGKKAEDLTFEQKKKAANMINLIEEKVNRGHTAENPVIKGRSVYNGRVQRGLYTKEETASPTVSQDAFFLTSIIDATEDRDKAITDIKGAYLNAKMVDEVFMKIVGREVDLFCELDPSLKDFVTTEKGQKVLYVQLDKALYGCVQSALLWYDLYANTLKGMGFVLNPYDMCVANATIKGSQCTVCWYVDDNKISHKDSKVVDQIIEKIEAKFGKMSSTRGDKHDFLGMELLFKENKVKVSMKKHIKKAFDMFQEDIVRNAATPASSHLFKTRDSPKLDEGKAENFHSVTALLLFISRRCRLDIQTAGGFLTTKVSEPDEDDWKKLKRVLQYLRGTIDLVLTIGADDITKAKSWVDVSYAIHNDCRSHTGGAMSWGWGVLLTKCQKQKLNTKSSTEGEIVGVSDFMPNMIWARMFLEGQGILLKENILYQDNQSAIKIVENGKKSSGQKTKHMDARYFWIKDRVKSEGIKVEYCPTEKMIADFFTKPLQGALFRKFRDIILGYKHISSLHNVHEDATFEERVGENVSGRNVKSTVKQPSVIMKGKGVKIGLSNGRSGHTYAEVVKQGFHEVHGK